MNKNISLLPLVLLLIGCGPNVVPLSGTVTLNGEPLKDMVVLLQPISESPEPPEAASGKTDAGGHFTATRLHSKKGGVFPGEYSVIVNWRDPSPPADHLPPNPCPYEIPASAKDGSYRWTVPEKGPAELSLELSELSRNP